MNIYVPVSHRGASLPLGCYYPIIVETDAERDEVQESLAGGWHDDFAIDLLDHRPSSLWSDRVLISRYDPPIAGWPWVAVTRWPDSFRDVGDLHRIEMARGCYTMELFGSPDWLDDHCAAPLDGLGSHYPINVRMLAADTLPFAGIA